jgi:hypothetical protein
VSTRDREALIRTQYALLAAAAADDSDGVATLLDDLDVDDARALLRSRVYSYLGLWAAAAGVGREQLVDLIRQRVLDHAANAYP